MGTRARHHHATTRPEPVTPPHLLDDGPPARAWDEPSWPDPTLLADDVMAAVAATYLCSAGRLSLKVARVAAGVAHPSAPWDRW